MADLHHVVVGGPKRFQVLAIGPSVGTSVSLLDLRNVAKTRGQGSLKVSLETHDACPGQQVFKRRSVDVSVARVTTY